MNDAIDRYLAEKLRRGRPDGRAHKPGTLATNRFRLEALHEGAIKLDELTPRRCTQLYEKRAAATRPDTHRGELATAMAFGAWCAKQGMLRANPWADVQPLGGERRGKEQLRIDEARRLLKVCDQAAAGGDVAALMVACLLGLGVRIDELVSRVVRDLDDGGAVLWIPDAKTENGKRTLEVPEELQPLLLGVAGNRPPQERLFPRPPPARQANGLAKDDVTDDWLRYHLHRLCKTAKVPTVCPHSLRGTHATIAEEHGVTPHVIAKALGWGSIAVGRKHYIKPEATRRSQQRRAMKVLQGGRS